MKIFKKIFVIFFIFLLNFSIILGKQEPPKLTVVFVIDQFAHHYINKLKPYLNGGIKKLLDSGVVFNQAHYPHARPETAPGHTTLSTGTIPRYHGITTNYWFENKTLQKIKSDDDSSPNSSMFSPTGLYSFGYSAKNLMVDGLSDQFTAADPENNKVFSFSLKSRAAIGMGNHAGKSVWFDPKSGQFSTSKAFFDTMPDWLLNFNKNHPLKPIENLSWKLTYPSSSNAYKFYEALNDQYSSFKLEINNNNLTLNPKVKKAGFKEHGGPYDLCQMVPSSNKLLLDLSYECLIKNFDKDKNRMLLWISMSSLDKIGHNCGPNSIAAIDTVYYIDKQIADFMRKVHEILPEEDVLYLLSADHGCMPIPEILKSLKINAQRCPIRPFLNEINKKIEKEFNISNFLELYNAPQVFINVRDLKKVPEDKKNAILTRALELLKKIPYVRNVWPKDELEHGCFDKNSFEKLFQNQLYPGRCGYFSILTQPYIYIDDHKTGTGHRTPYDYDTHVPLVFYRRNSIENKSINSKIFMTQVAPTIAQILRVPKPSASVGKILPGIFKK